MKRLLLTLPLAALLLSACRKDEATVDLTAVVSDQPARGGGKVYINDSRYACWHHGDAVNINGTAYTLSVEPGGDHKVAKILGVTESDAGYTAGYPAEYFSGIASGGAAATVTVPSVQTYSRATVFDGSGDSYQQLVSPMVAHCGEEEDVLKFHNVASVLQVTILNSTGYDLDMHFVTVEASSAYLAGPAPVSGIGTAAPAMEMPASGYHGITVDCSASPIALESGADTSLYVVSAPFSDQMLTVRVLAKDPDGDTVYYTLKATSAGPLSLSRNQMGQATFEIEECTCKPETSRCNYAFWGCGTESNPFLITSKADLIRLQGYMGTSAHATYNAGTVYYRQIVDIDASSSTWTNTKKNFWAHYDGGGYSIKLALASTGGFVAGMYGAEFKNLTLTGSCASTTGTNSPIGAFANYVWGEAGTAKFEDCTNKIPISCKASGGGFVGQCKGATTFTKCTNDADITGYSIFDQWNTYGMYFGGFVGNLCSSATLEDCTNNGTVSGGGRVGGMVGGYDNSAGPLTIKGNTTNNGNINSTAAYCGGILGGAYISFTVESDATVTNNGVINNTGGGSVGGIVGSCKNTACKILGRAINNNTVTSTAGEVGGIVGHVNVTCTVDYAQNNSAVRGTSKIGGIVGSGASGKIQIINSTNVGDVTGTTYVGGIVGQCGSTSGLTLTGDTNNATTVKGNQYVGGVLGGGRKVYAKNCVNNAAVKNNGSTYGAQMGGIAGQIDNNCDGAFFDHCSNTGSITSGKTSGETQLGGIVGRIYISANSTITIRNCSSTGPITGKEINGGLVGLKYRTGSSANCTLYVYNSFVKCTLKGSKSTCGIIGKSGVASFRTYIYNTYFDGILQTGGDGSCCDIGYSAGNNIVTSFCYAKVGCYSGTGTEHYIGYNSTFTDVPPDNCAYYDGISGTLYGNNAGSVPASVSIGGTQTNLGDALRAWQTANNTYTQWNSGDVPALQ